MLATLNFVGLYEIRFIGATSEICAYNVKAIGVTAAFYMSSRQEKARANGPGYTACTFGIPQCTQHSLAGAAEMRFATTRSYLDQTPYELQTTGP